MSFSKILSVAAVVSMALTGEAVIVQDGTASCPSENWFGNTPPFGTANNGWNPSSKYKHAGIDSAIHGAHHQVTFLKGNWRELKAGGTHSRELILCSGTLISNSHIVTAASCFANLGDKTFNLKNLDAIAAVGSHVFLDEDNEDRNSWGIAKDDINSYVIGGDNDEFQFMTPQRQRVVDISVHPSYSPLNFNNGKSVNLAVIRVAYPFKLSNPSMTDGTIYYPGAIQPALVGNPMITASAGFNQMHGLDDLYISGFGMSFVQTTQPNLAESRLSGSHANGCSNGHESDMCMSAASFTGALDYTCNARPCAGDVGAGVYFKAKDSVGGYDTFSAANSLMSPSSDNPDLATNVLTGIFVGYDEPDAWIYQASDECDPNSSTLKAARADVGTLDECMAICKEEGGDTNHVKYHNALIQYNTESTTCQCYHDVNDCVFSTNHVADASSSIWVLKMESADHQCLPFEPTLQSGKDNEAHFVEIEANGPWIQETVGMVLPPLPVRTAEFPVVRTDVVKPYRATIVSNDCDSKCDGKNAKNTCWCDAECASRGDCCKYFNKEVDGVVRIPFGSTGFSEQCVDTLPRHGTCIAESCGMQGVQSAGNRRILLGVGEIIAPNCWCDPGCEQAGDCCDNYEEECVANDFNATCRGQCGGKGGTQSDVCWCDDGCEEKGDCCLDYVAHCKSATKAGKTNGSCKDNCGNQDGQCWCDDYCSQAGDCCSDYNYSCNN